MAQGLPSMLRWLALALATVVVAAPQIPPALAQQGEEIEVETFYRELEPYGRWFEHPRYGHVWAPDVDDEDWRPYTRGNWVHTEEHGWYWESEEPFGWAVYHYGRWYRDDQDGWIWVPGGEWGPAWVAWRYSEDDVGWAPLPPEAEWRDGEISLASSFYDSPRFSPAWCFVPVSLLTAGRVWTHIAQPRRNSYYLGRTRFAPPQRGTSYGFYNGGFDRRRWEAITGKRAASHRITTVSRPFWDGPRGGRSGNDIRVYRPRVTGLPRSDGRPGFNPPAERRAWPEQRPETWGDRRPGGFSDRTPGGYGDGDGRRDRDGRRDGDWQRNRTFDRPQPRQPTAQPDTQRQGRGAPTYPTGRSSSGGDSLPPGGITRQRNGETFQPPGGPRPGASGPNANPGGTPGQRSGDPRGSGAPRANMPSGGGGPRAAQPGPTNSAPRPDRGPPPRTSGPSGGGGNSGGGQPLPPSPNTN